MKTQETVVFLGGGFNQIDYVLAARRKGFYTLGFDVKADIPASSLFDSFKVADISDSEKILNLLQKVRYPIVGCISEQSDSGLLTNGLVNDVFGLNGISYESASKVRDKNLQRAVVNNLEFKISQPDWFTWDSTSELYDILREFRSLGKMGVIKPRIGQGSHSTFLDVTLENVTAVIESLMVQNRYADPKELKTKFLVEEQIYGDHIAVDGFVHNSDINLLTISHKTKNSKNPALDKLILVSPYADVGYPVKTISQSILRGFAVDNVLFHIELVVSNREILLIEWSPRGCGSGVSSRLFNAMSTDDVIGHRLSLLSTHESPRLVLEKDLLSLLFFPNSVSEFERAKNLANSSTLNYSEFFLRNDLKTHNTFDVTNGAIGRGGQVALTGQATLVRAINEELMAI